MAAQKYTPRESQDNFSLLLEQKAPGQPQQKAAKHAVFPLATRFWLKTYVIWDFLSPSQHQYKNINTVRRWEQLKWDFSLKKKKKNAKNMQKDLLFCKHSSSQLLLFSPNIITNRLYFNVSGSTKLSWRPTNYDPFNNIQHHRKQNKTGWIPTCLLFVVSL